MNGDPGRHVTLLVPGLLGPVPADGCRSLEAARLLCAGLSLPALERFFSLATPLARPLPEPGLTALLFDAFGLGRQGPDWPVAAVTRVVDGAGGDGRWWLRADPVHLRAGMGDLSLADSTHLSISAAEAGALALEINTQMDNPDFVLEALAPTRWYLSPAPAPRLVTQAPWEVSGAPIGGYLPRGEDAGLWRALINDVQMILHASPVNRAREERGEPAINSLWLWGGGHAPLPAKADWQGVWGDDALVAGLAALAQAPGHSLPDDAAAWLARLDAPGSYLLVSRAAYAPARCSDVDGWRRALATIEDRWLSPLMDALSSARLQSISVRGAEGCDYRLGRARLGSWWWRRRKAFARVMSESRGPLHPQQR